MGPIAELVGVVDVVCGAEPSMLADGEAIEALYRQLDRLEAAACRASACFDAGGEWQADGARGAGAWIATRRRMPMSAGRRRVLLGRALRHLPETEQAWLAGDIGIAQVSLLAEARTPRTEEALARDEAMLVGQAKELQHRHFAKAMAYWAQLADPDGAEGQAKLNYQRRKLHLSQSWEGQWYLDGIFDAIGGEILNQELKKIEIELFHADWAEAKARVGDRVSPPCCVGPRLSGGPTPSSRWPAARPPLPPAPARPSRCSAWWSTTRPSSAPVSWAGGMPSPLGAWFRGSTRPGCSGRCSTARTGSRTSGFAGGCSPVPPGSPSCCGNGSASIPTATSPPVTARSTTSCPTPREGSPSTTTAGRRAGSITGSATDPLIRRHERRAGARMGRMEEIDDGDTVWRFDTSFLTSNWTCIWGRGCQGILPEPAEHLGHGCCSMGADIDGEDEARNISALAATLEPAYFEHHDMARDLGVFSDENRTRTRVVDGACIFLNRPGFAGGAGCALQLEAIRSGESPVVWKPSVCWQLPIKVDWEPGEGDTEVATVRGWERRDWGAEGDTMAWCCTEGERAYVGERPVVDSLAEELEAIVGPTVYVELRRRLSE